MRNIETGKHVVNASVEQTLRSEVPRSFRIIRRLFSINFRANNSNSQILRELRGF
jgi:hypothetical protein